jgi:ketosteroid isomerase-like protein
MTSTLTNASVVQDAYAAFAAGDIPGVLATFDENITWHVPGSSLISGDYVGHEGAIEFFTKVGELSGGTLRVQVDELLDNGTGKVVGLVTLSGTVNGRRGSFPSAEIWDVRDGKLTSYVEHYGDEAAMNEFWS